MKTLPPQSVELAKDDPYMDIINKGNDYLFNDSDAIEAKKTYDEAIALNPNRPEAYALESREATGTEPLRLIDLSLSKKPTGYAYELRANEYIHLSKFKEVIADATKALEFDDYTYHAYAYRAFAYLWFKQFAQALDDSQQALMLNSDDPQVWMLNGEALYGLGICQDAGNAFYTDVEVSNGDEEAASTFKIFQNADMSHCIDAPDDSGQEPPTPTSTPTGDPMTGVGA